ncbi:hypothetical protein M404DRAFT_169267 [Pisolithus tinctorius Marx 270]|uniref:Uncharacterized protein n=1 Tax=Pisolithus tinctorius Marx 270 TaxID=870435 RepID=A0A0C3MYU8_PISTI|nr:hypothetical protein M404DRAFT_169267 [Pisolithus tinctorius Marx 270]
MDTDPSSLPSNLEDLDPVISQTSEPEPATADAFPTVEVPLSDLWNAISNSHYYCVCEPVDLFQELQDVLASGDMPFYTPASCSIPAHNNLGIDDGSDLDFGIELPSEEEPAPGSMHVNFQHFLTELLFSSPRLPFSKPQKRAILSWAKELGAQDIPSLYSLNRCHEEIKNLVGNPTRKVISASGNIFYINDIANSIAKDYANPLTRFAMQDFPEDGGEGMSQVFNGGKLLHELPSPPAIRVDGTVYFVDELLQECSGDYFFPEHFFLAAPEAIAGSATGFLPTKAVYALGWAATRTEAGFIINDEREIIPTASFQRSFEEISRCPSELACGLTESSKKSGSLCPNVWHRKSGGRMAYNVPLIIFMDDISGNILKQWNKHHVIYVMNANLPREMLEQEFYVHFMMSSPHAAPMELMHAMKESIS